MSKPVPSVLPVLIVGGGIGGLATALSLHQIGVPCRVFESVPTLAPLGVGINLLPHAVRELDELGLQGTLASSAIATAELAYYSKRGKLIWSEPRGRNAGYRWPQFSIHRGTLQMTLLDAVIDRLGKEHVFSGHHFVGHHVEGQSVIAYFTDPQGHALAPHTGSVLVGADGMHSTLRAALYPNEGPPIWNGAILWRGITASRPFLTGRTMIMAGHEYQKFVCYPIKMTNDPEHPQLLNWVAEKKFTPEHQWRREDWNRAGAQGDFLPEFESWDFSWLSAPALIRGANAIFEYPMVDRDPLDRWTHGPLTLLGDAAHPMYPIGSNGASQAILDARVLAREISRHGPTPNALEQYEAERRVATARIVIANRGNGPEQVMQTVEERAPEGFDRIEDVLSGEELTRSAARYKQLAGFDKDDLNERPSIVKVGT